VLLLEAYGEWKLLRWRWNALDHRLVFMIARCGRVYAENGPRCSIDVAAIWRLTGYFADGGGNLL